MSFLRAQPEVLDAVAGELHSVNAAVREGSSAAATPTTGIVPAAADVVSILTAAQFVSHAQLFQEISAEAAATETQYGEMWAQDAAAMYGYADASA